MFEFGVGLIEIVMDSVLQVLGRYCGREVFEPGVDSSEIVVDSALEVVGR